MGKKYIIEMEDMMFHKTGESGTETFLWRVKGFNSLVFDMTGISKLTPYTEPDLERVKKTAHDDGYSEGYQAGREDLNRVMSDVEQVRKDAYSEGFKDGQAVAVANEQNNAFNDGYKKCLEDMELVRKEERDRGYEDGYQEGIVEAWEAARKILFNPDDGGMSAIDVNEVFGENSWTVMKDFSASEVVAKIKEYEDSKQKIKVGDEVEDGVANLVVLEINEDGTVEGFTDYGSVVHAIPRKKTGRYFPEVVALLKNMKGK